MELMPPALEAQSPNPGPPGKSPYHMYVAFWGWLFPLNLFNLTFIHVVVAIVHSFLSLTHLPLYACMVVGYSSAEIFGLLFILAVCSLLYTIEHVSMFSCIRLCATPWTVPAKPPSLWDCACKNTGVGCHFLLQVVISFLPDPRIDLWDLNSLTRDWTHPVCNGISESYPWTAEKSSSCFLFGWYMHDTAIRFKFRFLYEHVFIYLW